MLYGSKIDISKDEADEILKIAIFQKCLQENWQVFTIANGPFYREFNDYIVNEEKLPDHILESDIDIINYLFEENLIGEAISKISFDYPEENRILKEFKKIIKKNRVRISQVNLLEELYNDKKIDYNFYKKYVINAKEGLKHLVYDNIITLEEYNDSLLLPLKFGAVSMAKKTDSVIVPFASNGEYKLFGKRPKVKIGEGFKVSDMSLEDANNKLRKEIISLLVDILD